MQRWILVCVAVALSCSVCSEASAWGFRSRSVSTTRTVTVNRYASPAAAVADKAARMAASCMMAHLGGGFGGGNAEGVGCGATAAAALSACCFTGQRVCIASAVRQGKNGRWYAVKIFR